VTPVLPIWGSAPAAPATPGESTPPANSLREEGASSFQDLVRRSCGPARTVEAKEEEAAAAAAAEAAAANAMPQLPAAQLPLPYDWSAIDLTAAPAPAVVPESGGVAPAVLPESGGVAPAVLLESNRAAPAGTAANLIPVATIDPATGLPVPLAALAGGDSGAGLDPGAAADSALSDASPATKDATPATSEPAPDPVAAAGPVELPVAAAARVAVPAPAPNGKLAAETPRGALRNAVAVAAVRAATASLAPAEAGDAEVQPVPVPSLDRTPAPVPSMPRGGRPSREPVDEVLPPAAQAALDALRPGGDAAMAIQDASGMLHREVTAGFEPRALAPHAPSMVAAQQRVAAEMAALVRVGGGTADIELSPPELGRLRLRLSVRNRVLEGSIVVENAAVKQVLETNMDRLQVALERQGLVFERLDVRLHDSHRGHEREDAPASAPKRESRDEGGSGGSGHGGRESAPRGAGSGLVDYWL